MTKKSKVKGIIEAKKKADFDKTQGYTVHGFDKDGKPVVTFGKNYDKAVRESNKRYFKANPHLKKGN